MKINFRFLHSSSADRNQEFLGAGKRSGLSKNRIKLGELIDKSISNAIKDPIFSKLNPNLKVKAILELLNDKTNVRYAHLVYKAITGKDVSGFIKSDMKTLTGLSFVFRLKDSNNSLFKKNGIVIEANLVKVKQGELAFDIQNMFIMNLPKVEHKIMNGMIKFGTSYVIQLNPVEFKEEEAMWIRTLKKPIDIWKDDSKLNIGLWKVLMRRIYRYNISRKNKSASIFAYGDINLEITDKKMTKFIVVKNKSFNFNPSIKYFINNNSESSLKGTFQYKKTESSINVKDNFMGIIHSDISLLTISNRPLEKMNKTLIDAANKEEQILIIERNKLQPIADKKLDFLSKKDAHKSSWIPIFEYSNEIISGSKDQLKSIKKQIRNLEDAIKLSKRKISNIDSKILKSKKTNNPKVGDSELLIDKKNSINKTLIEDIESLKNINDDYDNLLGHIESLQGKFDNEEKIWSSKLKELDDNIFNIRKSYELQHKVLLEQNKKIKDLKKQKEINDKKIDSNNRSIESLQQTLVDLEKFFDENSIEVISGQSSMDPKKKNKLIIESINDEEISSRGTKIFSSSNWDISDYDAGKAWLIKTNMNAMSNLSKGLYKSPYLAIDLTHPETPITISNKDKLSSLNEKQNMAFQMINNSYQSSFLQGPPGTGKTQVISNIISYNTRNNEISLISSSTNEAINNAMERIDERNSNDPNIIFLRASKSKEQREKAKNYLADMIPINFINKVIASTQFSDDAKGVSEALEILGKYSEEEINKVVPSTYAKNFFKEDIVMSDIAFFANLISGSSNIDEDDKQYFWEDRKNKFSRIERKSKDKESIKGSINQLVNTFLTKNIKQFKDHKLSMYNFISSFNQKGAQTNFIKMVNKVKGGLEKNGLDKNLSKEIVEIVDANNLVNIIGITTTSKQIIKIDNAEREIFTDYPIDFAVIDEVSKSITPEIIQISSLASKFLYAGDYRQLPPTFDMEPVFIQNFIEWENNNKDRDFHYDEVVKGKYNIKNAEQLEALLLNLHESSLFKNQVTSIKKSSETTSYISLNVQHRFTKDICELVNVVYDEDEALSTHHRNKINTNEYVIDDVASKSSIMIYDTSYISKEFVEFAKDNNSKCNVELNSTAFDQHNSIFGNKLWTYNSRMNEYNAFTGISLMMELKEKNPKLKPNDIGYICMTRSQATLINSMINRRVVDSWDKEWLSAIKIDTVDNFQGREKDLVIVDLVRAPNMYEANSKSIRRVVGSQRDLAHYSRNERLNVAVSRAKSKLIILGAIQGHLGPDVVSNVEKNGSIQKIKIFEVFKDIVSSRGKVIEAWNK